MPKIADDLYNVSVDDLVNKMSNLYMKNGILNTKK